MTSTTRNVVIGVVFIVMIAAGAAIASSGGNDDGRGVRDTEAAASVAADDTTNDDGSATGGSSSGGSSGSSGSTGGSNSKSRVAQGENDGDVDGVGAPEPAAAPVVSAPSLALVNQRCSGGKLIASVTANASTGDRKGVQSVTMTRQNEEGAFIAPSGATWLGPDTGAGDQWDATLVGNAQGYGKTLRVVATSDAGQSTTRDFAINVPC